VTLLIGFLFFREKINKLSRRFFARIIHEKNLRLERENGKMYKLIIRDENINEKNL
jgi:hypothetical protein